MHLCWILRWYKNKFSHSCPTWARNLEEILEHEPDWKTDAVHFSWARVWKEQNRSVIRCTCRVPVSTADGMLSEYLHTHSNGWWMGCWMNYERTFQYWISYRWVWNELLKATIWKSVTLVTQWCHNTHSERRKNEYVGKKLAFDMNYHIFRPLDRMEWIVIEMVFVDFIAC